MSQHDDSIVLKILKGCHRVSQVLFDPFAHMPLHAVPHHQKAHGGESRGYEQHGKKKARAQAGPGYEVASGRFQERLRSGLC
jgi:hypothetical protein